MQQPQGVVELFARGFAGNLKIDLSDAVAAFSDLGGVAGAASQSCKGQNPCDDAAQAATVVACSSIEAGATGDQTR